MKQFANWMYIHINILCSHQVNIWIPIWYHRDPSKNNNTNQISRRPTWRHRDYVSTMLYKTRYTKGFKWRHKIDTLRPQESIHRNWDLQRRQYHHNHETSSNKSIWMQTRLIGTESQNYTKSYRYDVQPIVLCTENFYNTGYDHR